MDSPPSKITPPFRRQQFTGNTRAPTWGTVGINQAWEEVVHYDLVHPGGVPPLKNMGHSDEVPPLEEMVQMVEKVPLDVVWRRWCTLTRCLP